MKQSTATNKERQYKDHSGSGTDWYQQANSKSLIKNSTKRFRYTIFISRLDWAIYFLARPIFLCRLCESFLLGVPFLYSAEWVEGVLYIPSIEESAAGHFVFEYAHESLRTQRYSRNGRPPWKLSFRKQVMHMSLLLLTGREFPFIDLQEGIYIASFPSLCTGIQWPRFATQVD